MFISVPKVVSAKQHKHIYHLQDKQRCIQLTADHVQRARVHVLVEVEAACAHLTGHVLHHNFALLIENWQVALQDLQAETGIQELPVRLPRVPLEGHQTATVAQEVDKVIHVVSVQTLLAVQHRLDASRILQEDVEPGSQPEADHRAIVVKDLVDDFQIICK